MENTGTFPTTTMRSLGIRSFRCTQTEELLSLFHRNTALAQEARRLADEHGSDGYWESANYYHRASELHYETRDALANQIARLEGIPAANVYTTIK